MAESSRELREREQKKMNIKGGVLAVVLVVLLGGVTFFVTRKLTEPKEEPVAETPAEVDLGKVNFEYKPEKVSEKSYRLPTADYGNLFSVSCTDEGNARNCNFTASAEGFSSFGIEKPEGGVMMFRIEGKVRQINVTGFGTQIGNEYLTVVMADGSLRASKVAEILQGMEVELKTVEGVSNVVSTEQISMIDENKLGTYTTIANRLDGTFYDLADYL
ncbi:MAG: hypothetical protein Q4E47_02400 [Candidatus Saccharibacteria bacterium]|nr:hypothetical protein [Candidatus Saccharibacteria bacterium]